MDKKNARLKLSDELLTMIFYLFMLMCGFAAGTQLWSAAKLPAVAVQGISRYDFCGVFLRLYAPSAVISLISFLLALFAAGWLILPIFTYIVGGIAGAALCSFFVVPVDITSFPIPFTVSACFLCTLAVSCFIMMHAHILSHRLAYADGGRCAYTYSCGNILLASLVIFITDIIFAGIIHLQALFA